MRLNHAREKGQQMGEEQRSLIHHHLHHEMKSKTPCSVIEMREWVGIWDLGYFVFCLPSNLWPHYLFHSAEGL
jgi:hypothetical protein